MFIKCNVSEITFDTDDTFHFIVCSSEWLIVCSLCIIVLLYNIYYTLHKMALLNILVFKFIRGSCSFLSSLVCCVAQDQFLFYFFVTVTKQVGEIS